MEQKVMKTGWKLIAVFAVAMFLSFGLMPRMETAAASEVTETTDYLFYANEAAAIAGTPSSESGTVKIVFAVTIDNAITNGTVAADQTVADEGDTVTLTVTPDKGYMLAKDSLTVTCGETPVTVTYDEDEGTWSFKMPAGDVTVSAVFVPDLTQWAGLQAAFDTASEDRDHPTEITLTQNVTAGADEGYLKIPAGKYVVIDLYGHNIDRGLTSGAWDDGYVIYVQGNLTVTDSSVNQSGAIKGGNNTGNGGGVYVEGGSFTMTGGSVSYNTAKKWGGGVYVYRGSFTMSGGSVSDNTALDAGGGIYVNNGHFNVFGAPRITGNVKGGTISNGVLSDGTTENVYLKRGKVITVTGELTDTASIGVTMQNPGVFTSGLSGNGSAANFASDSTAYAAGLVNGEAALCELRDVTIAEAIKYGNVAAEKTRAIAGETVTLNVTPDAGYELGTLTYSYTKTGEEELTTETVLSGSISQNEETGVYTATFEMPAYPVTVNATFTINSNDFKKTDDNEYTIYTAGGWNVFCDCLDDNDTWNRFSGKTVKLNGDIGTAEKPITRMAGTSNHDFCGIFDGNHHTLTVNISSDSRGYTAPFSYVTTAKANPSDTSDTPAAIRNLNVAGKVTATKDWAGGIVGAFWGELSIENCTCSVTISTNNKHAAGFISYARGNATITNCLSSVTINSSVSGDGTHAGFIGGSSNGVKTTITGCTFNGSLLTTNGTTHCAGFMGYNSGTLTITNSLLVPAAVTVGSGNSATFARGNAPTVTNSYYTTGDTLGTAQGTAPYTVTTEDEYVTTCTVNPVGNATQTYSVSGITAYDNGIVRGETFYYGQGDNVNLALSASEREGYIFMGFTASAGTLSGDSSLYTLTMPDADVTVSANYISHWAELQAMIDAASGTESSPATIELTQDYTATSDDTCLTIPSGKYVTIDLDGHSIDRGLTSAKADGNVFTVEGNLTVTDSSENQSGAIKGGNNTGNGGGVVVDGGSFTLNGGSVSGNTASGGDDGGGGVYVVNEGIFTLNGGSVSGNIGANGGGVFVRKSSFTMNGGSVSGNTTDINCNGGGVYLHFSSFTLNSGTISCNDGGFSGGGVYSSGGTLFNMTGGTISGNTAGDTGGGVYSSGILHVSGTPVITGNVKGGTIVNGQLTGGTTQNVYMPGSYGIVVTGALTDTASIGVTMENPGVFADYDRNYTLTDSDLARFTSDSDDYYIRMNDKHQGELCAYHAISIAAAEHGAVTASVGGQTATKAVEGDTVDLTVTPTEDFVLAANGLRVSWTDEDNAEYDVAATQGTGNDADKWSFEMPDHNVTVSAVFTPSTFGKPDFTLPAQLTTIEESAFEGDTLITVVDASNCSSIGAYAFKDTGLTQIRLDKDCEIAGNAFSGCGTVYVFAQAGGKTKTFCDTHEGIVFVETE